MSLVTGSCTAIADIPDEVVVALMRCQDAREERGLSSRRLFLGTSFMISFKDLLTISFPYSF